MVSFLYEFISFFLQSSSSLYTSSNLVWKRCERTQNAVKLIRSEQPLRKQIAPLYTEGRQSDQRIQHQPSRLWQNQRPGPGFCRSQAADTPSRDGSRLACHHPAELKGCARPGTCSHLGVPATCSQGAHLWRGLLQKERSISSGQKWELWELVGASRASSHHPSPAGL